MENIYYRQFKILLMRALRVMAAGLVLAITIVSLSGNALAVSPPNIISYQGRILNSNGVPVSNTTRNMQFRFYDSLAGVTCLWSNNSSTCASNADKSVSLTDGLFSENLGDTGASYAAIPDTVFNNNAAVYLEVEIEGEVLTPRKRIVAAPYALNAQSLDGLDSADFLRNNGDTGTGEYDLTGAELLGASPLVFEGATNDGTNKTTFTFTDPTGVNTITFKDASGTVAFTSDIPGAADLDGVYTNDGDKILAVNNASGLIFNLTTTGDFILSDNGTPFATFDDSGNITFANTLNQNGDFTIGNAATDALTITSEIRGTSPLSFEGATNNNIYTIFSITDPTTSNKTITFPDASGTVILSGSTAGGDLSGTYPNPSVSNDSHDHTGSTLSGIDISDDTNLTGDTEIVLTGDTLSIASTIARDTELHSAVTLAGTYDYITLSGQQITRNQIDLSTDVTGTLPTGNIADAYLLNNGDVGTGSYDFTGAELLGASPLVFEGSSNDNVYTTFAFIDPTGANTITFKDGSGTVAFTTDLPGTADLDSVYDNDSDKILAVDNATGLLFNLTTTGDLVIEDNGTPFATFDDSGNITFANTLNQNGDFTIGNAATDALTITSEIRGTSPLSFEGATNNNIYTIFSITDPTTSNKTITFPDASGTVLLSGSTAGGDLSGTYPNPSVTNDSHDHTGATISGIDISSDTNLAGDTEIVLTGDALSIASTIARDTELHSAITLTGTYDYITLSGQQITRNQIDLTTDVTGTLPTGNIADAFLRNNGDTGTGSYDFTGAELLGASPLVFEGSSNDNVYTTFAFTDPTGANVITFPDVSGTIYTSGNDPLDTIGEWQTLCTNCVDIVSDTTSTLTAARGGTGQTAYTTGDLLYASGASALSKLADVAVGNTLISGGVGVAPSWGKIGLTTHVSGTLPVTNGGTGATTLNDLITLSTHTTGNYVASVTNGSGISGGNGGSEGAALTLALGALTADWNQTGAFDLALNNTSSELKILGSSGTYYGIFDVGAITGSDKTYTFPNASGTVAFTSDIPAAGANTALSNLSSVAINTSLISDTNNTDDLGSTGIRWRDLFLGPNTLHIGTSATDEGTISYNTGSDILNFGTDSTANGDIAFFTDDLYLDKSTGNVGIGTTAPDSKLNVVYDDTTTSDNIAYGSTIYASQTGLISSGLSDELYGLKVTATQNVSQVNLDESYTYGALFLADGERGAATNSYTTGLKVGSEGSDINTGGEFWATDTLAGNSNSGLKSNSAANGSAYSYGLSLWSFGTSSNRYGIYSTGESKNYFSNNVGIGTTGPTSILHTVASGAKTAAYIGNLLTNTATSSTASITKTGLSVTSTGAWNGTSAVNRGLYVNATGGTTNYSAIFEGGNVGIGTTAPSTNLEVNAPAIALDDEYLLKLGVSDAANDHLTFLNGTTANGAFAPTIWGNYDFDNQRAGLTLFSNITADTGTNPVMKFDAWSNLSGGPTTRPAFEFMSGGNQILTMDADKQVGIGTQSPSKLLEIFSQVATTDQFRLTYSSGVYTDLYTDASGNLTINPTGTNVTFGATSNPISLIPAENNTAGYTVGTSANRWKSGYFVDGIVTGASSTTYAESGITSTYAGALGITPASGQNLNISLATTGDFAVNTNQLYVDTSAGNVGIGTTAPGATLDVVYSDSTTTGNTTYGSTISATQSGVVTSGTDIIYGLDVTSSSTPAHSTGGNINVYGGRFTATGGDYGGSAGAIGLLGVASGAKSSNRGLFGQVTIGVEDADNTGVYGYVTGTHPGTSTTGFNYSFYGNNNAIYTGTSSVPKKYGIYSILGGEWDGSSYGGSFNNNSNNLNTTSTTNKYGIFVSTAGTSYANNSYGARIENVVINSGRDSTNKYGLYITSTGTYPGLTTTDTNNYGLYVDTPTGAVNNYAAVFAGGNVGIGTTSPSYQLQLSTDSAAKPTSNTWTVVSDSRLKENITPFTDGLSVINQINPVNYALNGHANMPAGDEGIGVIAQEIMGIAPYTVGTFEAKYNPDDETTQTFYSFDSSALTFVLINAVKELAVRLPAEPVNTASQMPTGSATLTALTMDGMIYMHGNDIVNIGRLAGLNNHWSIEPDGTIKTDKLLKTVITSYQNEMVETTAVTSTDTVITLSGSSELQNGQATITFEDIKAEFNDITSTTAPIYVVVTPNGPASLYVSSKDHNGFTVEQINGNDSGITFDWLVTAYRKDYEPVEQEPLVIDPPPTDPDPIATTDLVIIDPPPTDPDPIATTDIIDPIVIQDPLEEPPV